MWSTIYTILCFLAITLAQDIICGSETGTVVVCQSCSKLAICEQGKITQEYSCGPTQYCNSGNCKNKDDTLLTNRCGCNTGTRSDEKDCYRDYIDSHYYTNCTSGSPIYKECQEDYIFSEYLQECVVAPECIPDEKVHVSCEEYYTCPPETTGTTNINVQDCPENTIFDYSSKNCITEDKCSDPGEFDSKFKCNVYYSCLDDKSSPNYHCCPQGLIFDKSSHACVVGDGSCTRTSINDCKDEDYENTYCKYCQSQYDGYKYATYLDNRYPEVCTRDYYQCEKNGTQLVSKLHQCIEGQIFIGSSALCETIQAHTGCKAFG